MNASDDDELKIWNALQPEAPVYFRQMDMGPHRCTCSKVCLDPGIETLVYEYSWRFAEWSLNRPSFMAHPDGLAPQLMELQQLRKGKGGRHRREVKPWWARLWNWLTIQDSRS
jgi:hypothetical protein